VPPEFLHLIVKRHHNIQLLIIEYAPLYLIAEIVDYSSE
jgi:hypothetical protein